MNPLVPPSPSPRRRSPTIRQSPSPPSEFCPLRRPGRWIVTAVVLVLVAQFVHGLVTNPFYQWDRFGYWFLRPIILDGLLVTLEVTAYSAVLGLLGGIVLALAPAVEEPGAARGQLDLHLGVPLDPADRAAAVPATTSAPCTRRLSVGVPFGPAFFSFDASSWPPTWSSPSSASASTRRPTRRRSSAAASSPSTRASSRRQPRWACPAAPVHPDRLAAGHARRSCPTYVNELIGLIKGTSLVVYVLACSTCSAPCRPWARTDPGDIVPLLLVATVWYVILTSVVSRRPVLRRAALRQGRRAQPAADAAAEAPRRSARPAGRDPPGGRR